MQVAAVVTVYKGCLESVEVYASEHNARQRYKDILKEHDLTEKTLRDSEYYDIQLETDLTLY